MEGGQRDQVKRKWRNMWKWIAWETTKQMPNKRKSWMKWTNAGLNKLQRPFCKRQAPNLANDERKRRVTRGESGFTFVYVTHSQSIQALHVRPAGYSSAAVAPGAASSGQLSLNRDAFESKRARGTHEASVSRLMCSVTVFLLRPACLCPCCQRQSTATATGTCTPAKQQQQQQGEQHAEHGGSTRQHPWQRPWFSKLIQLDFAFLLVVFASAKELTLPGGLEAVQTRN